MTLLIPDARRGLLGGLVDDATMLGDPDPDVERAVDAYRSTRSGPRGWMVGRLVVPTSLLEDLAGVLVRTMKAGDVPMPIVALFDGNIGSDASKASAFHTTMDPAARIEVVRPAAADVVATDTVLEATSAARGIHHDVLPMIPVSLAADATPLVSTISEARTAALLSVGAVFELPDDSADVANLVSSIRTCVAAATPFTIQAEWFPASTVTDRATGRVTIGVLNALSAVLQTEASAAETASTLLDGEPGVHAITFTGMSRHGRPVRAGGSIGTDRSPLLSLSALEPASTLEALGSLDLSA